MRFGFSKSSGPVRTFQNNVGTCRTVVILDFYNNNRKYCGKGQNHNNVWCTLKIQLFKIPQILKIYRRKPRKPTILMKY